MLFIDYPGQWTHTHTLISNFIITHCQNFLIIGAPLILGCQSEIKVVINLALISLCGRVGSNKSALQSFETCSYIFLSSKTCCWLSLELILLVLLLPAVILNYLLKWLYKHYIKSDLTQIWKWYFTIHMRAFILLSYNNTNEKIWKVWGGEEVFYSPASNMENTETIELLSAVRKLHLSFIVERFIATVTIKLILIVKITQTKPSLNTT